MIPEPSQWQKALTDVISSVDELCDLLQLNPAELNLCDAGSFPLRVPRAFVERMQAGDPDDPLLKQVLPVRQEDQWVPGFSHDPLAELGSNPQQGLLHKYRSRVLLVLTGHCAIHCRYCFRRHFPYEENHISPKQWQQVLAYLAAQPEVNEVIFSGGDPLAISNRRLQQLVADLEAIPHLNRLRIHTRLPVVIPQRIDTDLIALLAKTRLQPVMVIHANHANEIDSQVASAMRALAQIPVPVLNQTVLLKGVNDSASALVALSEKLFGAGVMPYYLHLLDRVQGAAHFDVPEADAVALMRALLNALPGYLVPRLVREVPGLGAKQPVPF
ncbi:MAG TPA: EF-P beta-lysylation protein EpmB [Pseudomonadales bacterium]|nr:EF-P beta-lysylation protein EpmB [Pseudomonadales bacterium]